MRGLGKHTVTVYNVLPEVERQAAYRRTVLEGVTVEERSGAVAALNGSTSTDGLMLFIPGDVDGYVAPGAFDSTSGWTLRAGDVVAVGVGPTDAPDLGAERTYRITGVERFDGRHSIDHFEVAAS